MSGVNAKMLVHWGLGHGFIQSHEVKARNKNAYITKIGLLGPTTSLLVLVKKTLVINKNFSVFHKNNSVTIGNYSLVSHKQGIDKVLLVKYSQTVSPLFTYPSLIRKLMSSKTRSRLLPNLIAVFSLAGLVACGSINLEQQVVDPLISDASLISTLSVEFATLTVKVVSRKRSIQINGEVVELEEYEFEDEHLATSEVVELALKHGHTGPVRLALPGQVMTMDYREDRLNFF